MKSDIHINDKWLKLISIPILSFLAAFVLTDSFNGVNNEAPWKNILVNFTLVYVGWEINTWFSINTKKKFPLISQTRKRLVIVFSYYAIADIILVSLIVLITKATNFYDHYNCTLSEYGLLITLVVIVSWMIGGIYEALYFYSLWKKSVREKDQFQNESLQAQLGALKSRINPHFLFNSLNSLSSLMDDNSEQAKLYVEEMSHVYRYILKSSENETVTLKDELDFVDAYFFLLRTKYGDNILLEVNIEREHLFLKLPSLTLQILIENAVKHNIITKSKPLYIKIQSERDSFLSVKNNIQRKTEIIPSTKIGLANIQKRYELLGKSGMRIEDLAVQYSVTLPLIN